MDLFSKIAYKKESERTFTRRLEDCACMTISPTRTLTADLLVNAVTLNVPQTAEDGDTVTFSVTTQGGAPTSYQWSFEAPQGAGNNPQVNFSNPNGVATTAIAHWFALPNRPCPTSAGPAANAVSTYTIKITVTFQGGQSYTESAQFSVDAYWNPAGAVDPNQARVIGAPQLQADSNGVWRVVGMGTLARRTPTKEVFVPQTSQFFNKADAHEQEHFDHWNAGNLLGNAHQPIDFYNRIVNFTGTSQQDLLNQIIADFQLYTAAQDLFVNNQHNESERRAYAVSDPINPQYLYQNCGRY
jgi:hypothetical protein